MLIAPSAIAELIPSAVILRLAAHTEHAIDRATALLARNHSDMERAGSRGHPQLASYSSS